MNHIALTDHLRAVGDAIISNDGDLLKTAEGCKYQRMGAGTRFDPETRSWVQVRVWVKVRG